MQRYLDHELRKHSIIKGSQLGYDSTFGFSYTVTGYGPEVEKLHVMKLSFATDKEAESLLKELERFKELPQAAKAVPILEAKLIID